MQPIEPRPCPLEDLGDPVVFAKDQPEYQPLPALVRPDGVVTTEWELTDQDLEKLIDNWPNSRLRLQVHTFGQPLQPLRIEVV